MTERPEAREITSWQAAEKNAAEWMRFWGFPDARVTESGSDGGVDVRATGALAQVKREAKPVGRPTIQNLVGARGRDVSVQLFFFSLSGFSQTAFKYAAEMSIALFQYDSIGQVTGVNARARRIVDNAREPVPAIDPPGPGSKIVPLWDPEDVDVFYFRASLFDVSRALSQMNRMGGGEQRPVTKHLGKTTQTTIAPGWLKEYAGLVSFTAEVKYVERGDDPVVRLKWSSYSNGTPETLARVTNDAAEGMERAHDILVQLLGSPVAKPGNTKGAGRRE